MHEAEEVLPPDASKMLVGNKLDLIEEELMND